MNQALSLEISSNFSYDRNKSASGINVAPDFFIFWRKQLYLKIFDAKAFIPKIISCLYMNFITKMRLELIELLLRNWFVKFESFWLRYENPLKLLVDMLNWQLLKILFWRNYWRIVCLEKISRHLGCSVFLSYYRVSFFRRRGHVQIYGKGL